MPRVIRPARTAWRSTRDCGPIRPIPRRIGRPKEPDHRSLQRRRQMQRPGIARQSPRAARRTSAIICPTEQGNQRCRSAARLHHAQRRLVLCRSSVHQHAISRPPQRRRHRPIPLRRPLLRSPPGRRGQSTQTALGTPASSASHHRSAAGSTGNVTFAGRSVSPTAAPSNSQPCSTTCAAFSLIFCS